MTDWVRELCRRAGVEVEYRDFDGRTARAARETLLGVLRALDFDVASDVEARDEAQRLDEEARVRPIPHEVILPVGAPVDIALPRPLDWTVEDQISGLSLGGGARRTAIRLAPPAMGLHRLTVRDGAQTWTSWLIIRPERCVSLADLSGAAKIWGVAAPIYGMTDGAAAALGDYELLGEYATALSGWGADFIGVNPLHAMGRNPPGGVISPYSPSHRAFLNTWHVAGAGAETARASKETADLIDYPSALAAGDRNLRAAFGAFAAQPADGPEATAFRAYQRAGGEALYDFAVFEALADRYGGAWTEWPARYRTKDRSALAAFAAAEARALDFHMWTQWRADGELAAAQRAARGAGMRVGLYLDLAVGPRPDGAETWAEGSPLATGATLGAPPDPLCPAGQSWGLAPLSPQRCRDDGYAGFAGLLRAVMRHAGMIRIDHALGLMRAFWIPAGASEGAYVRHQIDALLAVVAIESVRNRCIVIGEDLGLVPAGLRDGMAARGVYGLDVLQYMRTPTGGFADVGDLRAGAVAAFSTHDTATVAGFFKARDAELQAEIGMIDDAELARIRADRITARDSLGAPSSPADAHRMLAAAPSAFVSVQLDDVAGLEAQQNLPGTTTEHPNWRRRVPFTLDEIKASPQLAGLAADMRAAGRAAHKDLETVDDHQNHQDHAH